jgi:hypothetical protein
MADVAQGTIEGFTRTCNADDTCCTVSFAVDNGAGADTPCIHTVAAAS